MNNKFIPLSVPNIKGNEIKYVTEALEAEWVSTAGAKIEEFEKNMTEYVHSAGAVACQSGTAGLHLALHYFGITENDAVIVPTLTFIAAVNPVKYEKAQPIFMDCDDSLCMDPIKLRRFLDNECTKDNGKVIFKQNGKMIKAIVVVHVFGNMADMEQIMSIATEYNLPIIEDATEALGTYYTAGKYKGKYAGTIGNVGVYSFNGNKIMTTGGGGMIVSNDKELLEKVRYWSTQSKDDVVNFIHNEIGFNYRMTNVQAAIGVAQLERLEEFIAIKERNYLHYKKVIDNMDGMSLLGFRDDVRTNYWFYSLVLDMDKYDKNKVIQNFSANNIQTRPIWGLISEQKPYQDEYEYDITCAKEYYNTIVNIPCSTNLSEADADIVLEVIKSM
ncbi:MAG: LegC family aminotransferase [Lachnospiraceae bacterium]|nr:LegC family aminotransferase [Lachnospiraceae bacterium]